MTTSIQKLIDKALENVNAPVNEYIRTYLEQTGKEIQDTTMFTEVSTANNSVTTSYWLADKSEIPIQYVERMSALDDAIDYFEKEMQEMWNLIDNDEMYSDAYKHSRSVVMTLREIKAKHLAA